MNGSEQRACDVAVIGGGVIGLACARELARAGMDVAVFSDRRTRPDASGAAGGMLAPWAELPASQEHLAQRVRALSLYPAWIEELQDECHRAIDMRTSGSLVVALEGEPPVRERLGAFAATIPGLHLLDARDARIEAPILSAGVVDAALLPDEGCVDPADLLDALGHALAKRGARSVEGRVEGIITDGDRAVGVRTRAGAWEAKVIVNAAGAYASDFAEEAPGTRAEVEPVRGQIVLLELPRGALPVTRVIQGHGTYLIPRLHGLVAGATSRRADFDASVREEETAEVLENAARLAPLVRDCRVLGARAGLRPYRQPGPRFGPDRRRRGLWHAIGMYRHGILLAPLAARRIREQVLAA